MSWDEGPTRTFAPPKLPATLRLGALNLTVSDLDRSVDYYEDAIGLRLHHREDGVAAMGVGEENLLVDSGANPMVGTPARRHPKNVKRNEKHCQIRKRSPGLRNVFAEPGSQALETAIPFTTRCKSVTNHVP